MEGGNALDELKIIVVGSVDYFNNALEQVQPFFVVILTFILYILFPEEVYKSAAIGLIGAMILDIFTKYYSLSVQNGGLKAALVSRAISSHLLWEGTRKKLVGTLVIMILCGLSVRVTLLTQVAVFISTVAYSYMFLKECQSIIENLIDAGHTDMEGFLFWLRRKESKVLEKDDIPLQEDYRDKL